METGINLVPNEKTRARNSRNPVADLAFIDCKRLNVSFGGQSVYVYAGPVIYIYIYICRSQEKQS